ncbi:MAG: SMP-30/gluconolactonase/LRE family protein, partial [Tepidisphaeraceae bacterium]
MNRSSVVIVWASFALCAAAALAHPASGIIVNAKGEVFFIHTGHGVYKIDTEGKLTCIHKVSGGGHWLAWDAQGRFSDQYPRLFQKLKLDAETATLLYASGGAPLVVNRDGNLYYGSGFPEGQDTQPGGHTLTRLSPDGTRSLFSPELKSTLEKWNEAVTGLASAPDGTIFVACPNAILKVLTDGTATTLLHPVLVTDREDDLARDSQTRFYHSPYLRGLDVADDGTVYVAVTGCRCVISVTAAGKVETVLKSECP